MDFALAFTIQHSPFIIFTSKQSACCECICNYAVYTIVCVRDKYHAVFIVHILFGLNGLRNSKLHINIYI